MLLTNLFFPSVLGFLLFYSTKMGHKFSYPDLAFLKAARAGAIGAIFLFLLSNLVQGTTFSFISLLGWSVLSAICFGALAVWITYRENNRKFPPRNANTEIPLLKSALDFEKAGNDISAAKIMERLGRDFGHSYALHWLAGKYEMNDKGQGGRWQRYARMQGIPLQVNSDKYPSLNERRDIKRIEQSFTDAAKAGDRRAIKYLAEIYLHGLGTKSERADGSGIPADPEHGMEWLEKLAEQGNPEDQLNLAIRYHYSWNNIPRDPDKAIRWNKVVLKNEQSNEEQKNSASREIKSARNSLKIDDYMEASNAMHPTEGGEAMKLTRDGIVFRYEEDQPVLAYEKFYEVANLTNPLGHHDLSIALAELWLGNMHCSGELSENAEESRLWYKKSARHGNLKAQLQLGKMLARGVGGPRNSEMAITLFEEVMANERADNDLRAQAKKALKDLGL